MVDISSALNYTISKYHCSSLKAFQILKEKSYDDEPKSDKSLHTKSLYEQIPKYIPYE